MSLPIRCVLCGSHAAETDMCRRPVFDYVCADAVACARRQLARRLAREDAGLVNAARGRTQVDRAVRQYRGGGLDATFTTPERRAAS